MYIYIYIYIYIYNDTSNSVHKTLRLFGYGVTADPTEVPLPRASIGRPSTPSLGPAFVGPLSMGEQIFRRLTRVLGPAPGSIHKMRCA